MKTRQLIHIVLEKILKAHVVLETEEHVLKIHDLLLLAELSNLDFSKNDLEYLKIVINKATNSTILFI